MSRRDGQVMGRSVHWDSGGEPWHLSIEWVLVDDVLEPHSLGLQPPPGRGITDAVLRRLPLATWIKEARAIEANRRLEGA